jgi:hypothetical protein
MAKRVNLAQKNRNQEYSHLHASFKKLMVSKLILEIEFSGGQCPVR